MKSSISLPLLMLLGAYLVLGVLYSIVNPIFEAGDELWHYPFVQYLATGHGLPVQDASHKMLWEQEGGEPPLYYALAATTTFWVDTGDLEARLIRNPFSRNIGVPLAYGNKNLVVHSRAEAFPWHNTTLAVHLIRLLGILLGTVTVAATYFVAKEIVTTNRWMPLFAAAIVAFNPMFIFISASVNNDSLAAAIASITLLLCVRLLTRGPTTRTLLAIGLLVGLGALTKLSDIGLAALGLIVSAWIAFNSRNWKLLAKAVVLILVPVIAIAGWWYLRNLLLYGDPVGINVWLAISGGRPPISLLGLLGEFQGFRISFWGNFGGVNLIAPEWVYSILDLVTVLAVLGLVAATIRREFPKALWIPLIWLAIILSALVRWTLLTYASQGRLIFPAISALGVLLAFGLYKFQSYSLALVFRGGGGESGYRGLPLLPAGVISFLFFFALLSPFNIIAPAYAPPQRISSQASVPNPVHIVFGDGDPRPELVGYEIGRSVTPGTELPLTLYWHGSGTISDNLYVYIHLFDSTGKLIGQWDALPGNGLYPTAQWQPDEIIADRYQIPVSYSVGGQQLGRVEAGLAEVGSSVPLVARDPHGSVITPSIARFKIASTQAAVIDQPALFKFGSDIEVLSLSATGERGTTEFQIRSPLPGALDTALQSRDTLRLDVAMRALQVPGEDYTMFVHLVDSKGWIVAQRDTPPHNGYYPTSFWDANEQVTDQLTFQLPASLASDDYHLEFGFYNPGDMVRLPVSSKADLDWKSNGDHVTLGPIAGAN